MMREVATSLGPSESPPVTTRPFKSSCSRLSAAIKESEEQRSHQYALQLGADIAESSSDSPSKEQRSSVLDRLSLTWDDNSPSKERRSSVLDRPSVPWDDEDSVDGNARADAAPESSFPLPSGDVFDPVRESCGNFSFRRVEWLRVPLLTVQTDSTPISIAAVEALLDYCARVLEHGEQYAILWDLRETPSTGPIWTCIWRNIRWAGKNQKMIDQRTEATILCIPSPAVRSIANFVLSVTRPPMPHLVAKDLDEALAFAREHLGPTTR